MEVESAHRVPVDAVAMAYGPHLEYQLIRYWGSCCDKCAMEDEVEKLIFKTSL